MGKGSRIIEGLRQAVAGDFASVTIDGETWSKRAPAWQPINTVNKYQWDDNPDAPQILLACFRDGRLLWSIAATYGTYSYGYIQCASRTGWRAEIMPEMARSADRFKHPGEWISASGEIAPTHWMSIPPLPAPPSQSPIEERSDEVDAPG